MTLSVHPRRSSEVGGKKGRTGKGGDVRLKLLVILTWYKAGLTLTCRKTKLTKVPKVY